MATKVYAACKQAMRWDGRRWVRERMEVVRQMVNLTIAGDWEPGFGPGGHD